MPIPRQTLVVEEEPDWDTTRWCWTLTRDDGRGKIHIGYVPWLPWTICHHRMYIDPHRLIAEWMDIPRVGAGLLERIRAPSNICETCLKNPGRPFESLLPPGWDPPMTRDDALVMASWWNDHDEPHKEACLMRWATVKVDRYGIICNNA